jgi:hypothetical protein
VCVSKTEINCCVTDECNLDWCDGLGMLIIIVVLVYFGLFYYYVIKKHYGKTLYNTILKPINKYFNTLLEHRYIFKTKLHKCVATHTFYSIAEFQMHRRDESRGYNL